jgi:catechol 2,3-dioxygenase-like lactoylglutathione lyase family enzyme
MISKINLVTLYVTDQDAAKRFYVDVLGFVEKTDVSMGDGFRWVTVGHPEQPELDVSTAEPSRGRERLRRNQRGRSAGNRPVRAMSGTTNALATR